MKPAHLFNHPDRTDLRRKLRKDMPTAEAILWSELIGKQINGLKFRRQYGVGPYVIDFYCPSLRLAIEVDGDSHCTDKAEKYDRRRQEYIESKGITVCRCTNNDVYENIDGVIEDILFEAEKLK